MRWIGVDLHKHYAHVHELNDDDGRSYRFKIPGQLQEFCDGLRADDSVVVEASTNSFRFAEIVARRVARMVVSDATQTRGVVSRAAMNDENAAVALARLLKTGFLRSVWVPPVEARALRCQVAHYRDLDKMRSQTINRIRSLFQQELIEFPVGRTIGVKAQRWFASSFTDQPGHRLYLCSLIRQYNLFNSELAELEKCFGAWVRKSNEGSLLLTIPGISPILAAVIMSQIGDVERFPSADKLCAHAGLVPRVYQSGKALRTGRITRSGPGIIRWALYLAIWNQRNHKTAVMTFKRALAERRPKMVANIAACRKLLTVIWSMLKHGTSFRDEDVPLTARKRSSLASWPAPSVESFDIPRIPSPRPSRKSFTPKPTTDAATKTC